MGRNSYYGHQRSGMKRKYWIIIAVSLITICTLSFLGFHTTEGKLAVVSKNWNRTIVIQKYDWVHYSRESSFVPDGAINVRKWTEREVSHYTDSNGKRKSRTHYNNHVSYDVQEWCFSREVSSSGTQDTDPFWGAYILAKNPPEREGIKEQKYTINFQLQESIKTKVYKTKSFEEYSSLSLDRNYVCSINGFGFITKVKDLSFEWKY